MEPNAHGSLVKERTTAPSASRGCESSHRCLHQKDRHASLEAGRLPSSPRNGLWEPSGNEFQNRENKEHQGRAYVCAWLFSLLLLAEQSSASTAPSCPHLPTALSPAARLRRAPVAAPISTSLASSSVASLPSTAEIGRSQVGIDWFLLFLLEWISFGRGRQGERVPGHHLCIPCWCHSYLTHLRPDSATSPPNTHILWSSLKTKSHPSLAQKSSMCKAVFSSEVLIAQKQVCLVVSCMWLAYTGHPFLKLKILLFNHVKILCLDTLEEGGGCW